MLNLVKFASSLFSKGALRGSATALAIKFAGSILGFAMFAIASRQMDPATFGSFAIIFNVMSFLAVVVLCGQETLIIRSWNEYCGSGQPGMAKGLLTFGAQVVSGAALLAVLAIAIVWPAWDRTVSMPLLIAACAFLVAQALVHFSGLFSRAAAGVLLGDGPREVVWRLLVVATITLYHVFGLSFGPTHFFLIAAGALLAAAGAQLWFVARIVPEAVKRAHAERDVRVWIPRAAHMWVSALLDTTGQYLEVVAIGFFIGPTAAAFYFVATRITNVFAMITGGIASYATSQIGTLFYGGAKEELQTLLRSLAIISATLVGGCLAVILVGGHLLLWAFGASYVSAYPALVVLAVGSGIAGLAGPAAHVLLLTGQEAAYPRIMACGLIARFALIAILGPWFGLMGAAIAWSLSAAGMALALVIACRKLVGLDPSLFGALSRNALPMARLKGSLP